MLVLVALFKMMSKTVHSVVLVVAFFINQSIFVASPGLSNSKHLEKKHIEQSI